jgi:peptide methionine sulfoxide reductase MsrB
MDSSQILEDPTLSSPYSGALDIFAKGLDNNLWHRWAANGPWSSWENVSAATGSGTITSSPGSVSWSSNRVDIVARMSNGTVGHWYHDGAWHYENLGGSILGDPDIASVSAGHLNIFARSSSGALVQKWWDGSSWSGWYDVSAIVGSGSISSGIGAVATTSSTLDVVARMPAGNIGVFHWSGVAWSFESLSGQILGDPDVSSVGSGAANVYARGLDGNLWQQWRVGSGWSGWQNVSALTGNVPIASGPGAASWNSTRVDVVGRRADGTVGHWWYG